MRVAVTGAGGHLGGTLVRCLIADGHEVVAIDLHRTRALADLDLSYVHGDVLDRQAMEAAFDGVDVVCHLAAVISVVGDPTGIVRMVNAEGPATVADAAMSAGVRRMIHCSSVHAFDLSKATEPLTETAPRAIHSHLPAYDRSKWAGEQSVQSRIETGLDAVIVNPTGVIGPYDFAPSRMGQVFLAIRKGRLRATIDGGFDWVDVRDVASGIVAAIDSGRTGENYLLSGHRVPMPDLASIAASVAGVEAPKYVLPQWLAKLWGPLGTRLALRNDSALSMTSESLHALFNGPRVSSAKARVELGYTARPFEETVRDLYAWFEGR
jgi:dihydroflavonol-4-reductase